MSEALMRQWTMLRMIPRFPAKISTGELRRRLAAEGYATTKRTIQRDLNRLSSIYPLLCDDRDKPFGWSWHRDADVLDIPGMDAHAALAFWLVREHLEPILPPATLAELQPYFSRAGDILDAVHAAHGAPAWRRKVRVLHRGPKLRRPEISLEVQHAVYDALLYEHRLAVRYRPRGQGEKAYELNPLGLVLKEGVLYLVCSMWDYDDIRLLTLHRMLEARKLDAPARVPAGFDLDAYIAAGELDYAIGGSIRLEARFSAGAAHHLGERPLADDQVMDVEGDGWIRVRATVTDTAELRWWLLGFGDQVEVLAPASLRQEIAAAARRTAAFYRDG